MNVKVHFFLLGFWIVMASANAQTEATGYRIAVQIEGLSGDDIILAHRYGDKFFSDDTTRLDETGQGVFSGSQALPHGMYQLVLPDKSFLDFFLDEDQDFSMATKVGDLMTHNQVKGHRGNELFFNWQRASALHRQDPAMRVIWDTTIQSAGNSFTGKFLRAIRPFELPEELIDNQEFLADKAAQYHYYKEHFFDEIDFTDPALLRSPVIHNKLSQFFSKVVPPQADSIIYYCDEVLKRSRPSEEVFSYTLQFLFNYYAEPRIMGTDRVYVYLADKYYLTGIADWIDKDNLKIIEDRVSTMKPLLMGSVAPRVKGLQTPQGEIIDPFEQPARYTILYFYEPDCGHCKTATPELYSLYPWLKSLGAEVFAINTRVNEESWNQFIAEHTLLWPNLWCPTNTRELLETYQAWSTPQLFILDGQKRIIAKDLSVSQVKDYMTWLTKSGN